jgi:hypothetical protein
MATFWMISADFELEDVEKNSTSIKFRAFDTLAHSHLAIACRSKKGKHIGGHRMALREARALKSTDRLPCVHVNILRKGAADCKRQ